MTAMERTTLSGTKYLLEHEARIKVILDQLVDNMRAAADELKYSTSISFDTAELGHKLCRAIIIHLRNRYDLDVYEEISIPQDVSVCKIIVSWGDRNLSGPV